ncbi:MAG: hypothetical protein JWQ27_1536 [Ferruginibacter sp.]|nr:hypothetical protein [Ferruginibacter sp.]
MISAELIIAQTKKWLNDVVIGCNFCPFAAREFKSGSIEYVVVESADKKLILEELAKSFQRLNETPGIETSLLILPVGYETFGGYWDLVGLAERLLKKEQYEGIYQLASFHPEYIFSGADKNDPANFTNRSPYAMLHILREESVEKAIARFPGTEKIPEKNMAFATAKGLAFMQQLKDDCMNP